jgi:serine/threonine-protein kinase
VRERLGPDRWRAVIPHLDRALDLPREKRTALLAGLRAEDASLADDLEALLARHEDLDDAFPGHGPAVFTAAPPLAGQVVGAYTLRAQIGQGGMGSVWLAERSDGRYEGVAAVKLLNAALAGREGEARFRREASILARLRHPHIAHLIDAGVSAIGQPYLVLERVDGERIDRYCDARRMGVDARVRLFLGVLDAVAHAHANLVVHRDIKPSNVLVAADGRVKLLDFGIAKLLEAEGAGELTALTREGHSALTPEYAAPEQLTGGDVTTATDVYALGVLLYLLLTGRHPTVREASSPAELIRAIVDTDPLRVSDAVTVERDTVPPAERAARRGSTPRRLRGALRGDLDNVVARALKKRPEERYASAEAMADDLRRFLDHQPVRARPDSLGYRTQKFVGRHRLVLGAAAVAVAALAAGAAVAARQARASGLERDHALVQLQRAEATNDFNGFLLKEATPSAGRPLTNAELLARGEALIERRFAGDPVLRVHMLLMLADRYYENNQFDRWQATLERAFVWSRGVADVALRSRAGCARAYALADQGRFEQADRLLEGALADLAGLSDAAADEAYCRVYEASLANRRGDARRAVPAAERAVALERERGGPPGRGFEALFALASAYNVAGRSAAADRVFREMVSVLESQGLERTRDAAVVLTNWSAMLQDEGHFVQAIPVAEGAVRIARERDTERGASIAQLRNLGEALCRVGRCAEAVPLLEESAAKARAGGSPRRLVSSLAMLAMAYREGGRLDRAAATLKEAEAALEAGPEPAPRTAATVDEQAALLALARGEGHRALALAQSALAREDDTVRPEFYTLTFGLVLADAQNANAEFGAARATAERSLKMAIERLDDMKHSYYAGLAHFELGVALAGLAEAAAAREELRQALDHLRASVGEHAPSTRRALAQLERLGG